MTINSYFNNFSASNEQGLYEDLIIESIRMYGQNMIYIPRVITNYDKLLGEDSLSEYNTPYTIEMYIKSVNGFTGDGNFMSKFGLEIRDQVIFTIAQKVFTNTIGNYTGQSRPNEGDIVYFPLNKKCFQIKYTNKFEMFYQFGALQTWEITCELFEYSDEKFNTGITEIDIIQKGFSTDILDWSIMDEEGNYLTTEDDDYLVTEKYDFESTSRGATNDVIQDGTVNFDIGSNDFIDFTAINPFSEERI
jgi:hypothetical protein